MFYMLLFVLLGLSTSCGGRAQESASDDLPPLDEMSPEEICDWLAQFRFPAPGECASQEFGPTRDQCIKILAGYAQPRRRSGKRAEHKCCRGRVSKAKCKAVGSRAFAKAN